MAILYKKTKKHYPVEDYLKEKEKYEFYCSLYRKLHFSFDNEKRDERVIDAYSTSNRIAWVKNKVFAEFHVCATKVTINMIKPINNSKHMGKPIPITHGWHQLNWTCDLTKFEDIEYVLDLINQSYDQA